MKTGRQSPSHVVRVRPNTNGHFAKSLGTLIQRLAADAPAKKVPSGQECRFCDITTLECPERMDEWSEPQGGTTSDF